MTVGWIGNDSDPVDIINLKLNQLSIYMMTACYERTLKFR